MTTQRLIGPMGQICGLRYEALPFLLRLQQVPRSEWPEVMHCIQTMEYHMIEISQR